MSKVIAIIDKPENCQSCVYGVCKYSLPLSKNTKCYYCRIIPTEKRVLQEFDYDADVHLDNCPLRPIPEKKEVLLLDGKSGLSEWNINGQNRGWNDCIDAIAHK